MLLFSCDDEEDKDDDEDNEDNEDDEDDDDGVRRSFHTGLLPYSFRQYSNT